MCEFSQHIQTYKYIPKSKPRVGYKVLDVDMVSPYFRDTEPRRWELRKELTASDIPSSYPSVMAGYVGFHIWLSLTAARRYKARKYSLGGCIIVKVHYWGSCVFHKPTADAPKTYEIVGVRAEHVMRVSDPYPDLKR